MICTSIFNDYFLLMLCEHGKKNKSFVCKTETKKTERETYLWLTAADMQTASKFIYVFLRS